MTGVFGDLYASSYDALYEDKDYEGECDLFERVFKRFATAPVRSVLDLGCGTGGHAWPMARRGYDVVGVDRSAGMLAAARAKGRTTPGDGPSFVAGDIRALDLGRTFDAVLMPFAVLGCQLSDDDVRSTLRTIRRHLPVGGLLLFDIWWGSAVLRERPADRVKRGSRGDRTFLRSATATLDPSRPVCTVDYHLREMSHGRLVNEVAEAHRVRYFFRPEIEQFLASAGLVLEQVSAFPQIDAPADEASWNALVVARAGVADRSLGAAAVS